ncbi:MAG TPA: hypothetical protein VMY16_13380 [Ilumatobacteraceae bacterium]|nr:hypothetical protein [Ilumatobacteraceae bacterium]
MTSFTPVPPGARPAPSQPPPGAPLVEGPRWYRSRLRTWGPCAALIVPSIVGAIAFLSLRLFDTAWSGAVGLIGGVFAAPALLAAGAPFGDRGLYPIAVAASGVMWLLIGFLAARRATRNPMATWSDFWRHYAWMCAGVWVGAGTALVVAALSISDSLV